MTENALSDELRFSGPALLQSQWNGLADTFVQSRIAQEFKNNSREHEFTEETQNRSKHYSIKALNTLNALAFGTQAEQKHALQAVCKSPPLANDICALGICLSHFASTKDGRPLQDKILEHIVLHWIDAEKEHGLYPPPPISSGEQVSVKEKEAIYKRRDALLNTPKGAFLYNFLQCVGQRTLQARIKQVSCGFAKSDEPYDRIRDVSTVEAYHLFQNSTFRFQVSHGAKFMHYINNSLKEGLYSKIKDVLSRESGHISLDATLGNSEDEGQTLGNILEDSSVPVDEVLAKDDMAHKILGILDKIANPRDAQIIRERLGLIDGEEKTLDEVGKKHNITRERVRQIEAKGLKKIRQKLGYMHEGDASKGVSLNFASRVQKRKNNPPENHER